MTEEFERDGYVVLDDFLQPYELLEFTRAFVELERILDGRPVGEIYDTAAQLPEFLRIVSRRRTAMLVNVLMGRPDDAPVFTHSARCRIDPPYDHRRCYGWHQETYYGVPGGRFIQTWAPLIEPTTLENGTIEVAVGSHKHGVAQAAWTEEEGRPPQILVPDAIVSQYETKAVPMRLGQLMAFDSRLFHRSGRNTSNSTRYTLVGHYHDVSAPGFRAPGVRYAWRGPTPRQAWEGDHAGR